ncbi:MAG: DAK2 domain-containing protein [Gemmatimonadales bacterium]
MAAGRDEMNRINVLPVPDGDTGTNFSLTLRANSGMMLAHFLHGFADSLGERPPAAVPEIAAANRQGADRLGGSVDDPREGTILTVVREAADAAQRAAAGGMGFVRMLDGVVSYIEGDVRLSLPAPSDRPDLAVAVPAAAVEIAAERDYHTASAVPWAWPCWRTFSRSMCTPIPPRPSLRMRRAGGARKPPRRTTCGPSTGASPTPTVVRSPS